VQEENEKVPGGCEEKGDSPGAHILYTKIESVQLQQTACVIVREILHQPLQID
jgi:hypothetical protein